MVLHETRKSEVAVREDARAADRRPSQSEAARVKPCHGRAQDRIDIPALEHQTAVGRERHRPRVVDAVERGIVDDVVDREQEVISGQPRRHAFVR